MRKILIVRLSSLGDVILTMPVITALRQAFPDDRLYYLTTKPYQELVEMNACLNQVDSIDSYHGFQWFTSLFKAIKLFRNEKIDVVVDLHFNHWSYPHAVIWLFIFTRCIGVSKRIKAYRPAFQRRSMRNQSTVHVLDWYQRSLERHDIQMYPVFSSSVFSVDMKHAREYLSERGIIPGAMVLGFAPEASCPHKRWNIENFRDVSRSLAKTMQAKTIVFTKDARSPLKTCFGKDIGEGTCIHVGGFSLKEIAAFLSCCSLLITNDSGLMHMAFALGIPVVAIFGPTHPCLGYAPFGPKARVFYSDISCSPCSSWGDKRCTLKARECFNQISPDQVVLGVRDLLKQQ